MPKRPAKFTQADIARALKGARAAGLVVAGFKVEPDGAIQVMAQNDNQKPSVTVNAWDEVYDEEAAEVLSGVH